MRAAGREALLGLNLADRRFGYPLEIVMNAEARGHFPTDDAAVKLPRLAIINIEDKRARERAARRQGTGKRGAR
jgi:transposase-like protein